MSTVLAPCRNFKKKKRKKKETLPDTDFGRVLPVPVSDTGTRPKMACPCNIE